jgi:enoyl-CoA hydratase/carnithine racemase
MDAILLRRAQAGPAQQEPDDTLLGPEGECVSEAVRREIGTGTPEVLCHVEERVGVVTLNRPEARNALTLEMKRALLEVLPELAADTRVGAVLLTGAGAAFCSGGDTKKMAADGKPPSPEDRKRQLRWEHGIPRLLHRMEKPTLAALPGPAAGAGFALALACDLRVMAESAFVTTSYVKLGLSGDYGASWFLTRLVGTARAREILFTGDRVDAAACERLGLANRVVPDSELAKQAMELARQIAAGPPVALRYMKDNLNRSVTDPLEAVLDIEAEHMVQGATTEDYVEAVKAFQEKRPPVFRGR